MTQLTGPENCAECGTEITPDTVAESATVTVIGRPLDVPGLYRCAPCAVDIAVGDREPAVTIMAAGEFLTGTHIPLMVAWVALFGDADPEGAAEVMANVARSFELVEILASAEALRRAREEHPARARAALN